MKRLGICVTVLALVAGMAGCGPIQYTVSISSTEGGTVTIPGEGTFTYDAGTVVDLAAEAEEGYQFLNWTGDVDTVTNISAAATTITVRDHYSIIAKFAPGYAEQIWDWYDLHAIRDNPSGHYVLMKELDAITVGYEELAGPTANGGKGWQPIGAANVSEPFYPWESCVPVDPFTGILDGQGYEIRDLFIDRPDEDGVGLFGAVDEGGVIDNVGVTNATVIGLRLIGGPVGYGRLAAVNDCHFTGIVTGEVAVGGLVGLNLRGTVGSSYSSSNATGVQGVGGLVGMNYDGALTTSYCMGAVTGDMQVGGLVGVSAVVFLPDSSSITMSGAEAVGAPLGINHDCVVYECYSAASVYGDTIVGGLVGDNDSGFVYNSHSVGSVIGFQYCAGGLVGLNSGIVENSHSTGSVTGVVFVGGLVGLNHFDVSNSYCTGNVHGDQYVGGLVGANTVFVKKCHSTGSVIGEEHVGGLVGGNEGTVSDAFWDVGASGMGVSDGGTGKTTAEMMDIATFTNTEIEGLDEPWDIIAVAPGVTNDAYIWNIVDGETYPFLSWESVV